MPEPPENPDPEERRPPSVPERTIPFSDIDRPPQRIGPYRILEVIGEGGMGTVYLAEQQEPVRRRVALKLIKPGMDSKEVVARFESERQALALMDHPNIAKVLDAGTTEYGRPYFVMEHVSGEPITLYCDRQGLTTRARLELLVQVCRAIRHAHQKAIIHRDIKPSNVLVAIPDERPVPKVIDFGVAKATGHRLTERTVFTEQGQLIGTPDYMSPEQAEMTGLNVDTRTDIYSLGVLLYELLTGTLPFDPNTLRKGGLSGIQKTIREEEPPRPSTRIVQLGERAAQAAEHRKTSVHALRKRLQGELDWITMRAMEKDRARRYQSASEFAADIERYLSGDPVAAGPPSTPYRLRKYMGKHRGPVAAVTAVVVASVMFGAIALVQREEARRQGALAEANVMLASATSVKDPVLKALLVAELDGSSGLTTGQLNKALDVLDTPLPVAVLGKHESFPRMEGAVMAALSPDGQHAVTASLAGTAWVWRIDGRGEPIALNGQFGIDHVAFSSDGQRIVTCGWDRTARVWRLDGGEPVILRGHTAEVLSATFSPDAQRIATASKDGTARIWPADGIGEPIVLSGHTNDVVSAVFSPDGTKVVTASKDGTARIWSATSGKTLVLQGHEKGVVSASFNPDGTAVVTASEDGTARIWSGAGFDRSIVLRGHKDALTSAAFSPDGTRVVTASADRTARIWPADGKGESVVLEGHEEGLWWAGFTPDGARIITASEDGTARVWEPFVPVRFPFGNVKQEVAAELYRGRKIRFHAKVRVESEERAAAAMWMRVDCPRGPGFFDNMGDRPITSSEWRDYEIVGDVADDAFRINVGFMLFGSGRVWMDAADLETTDGDSPANGGLIDGNFEASDLKWTVTTPGYRAEMVEGNQVEGRRCVLLEPHTEPAYRSRVLAANEFGIRVVALSAAGNSVLTSANDGAARVWRADGAGEPVVLRGPDNLISAEFSPDGRTVVARVFGGNTQIWQADGTEEPLVLKGYEGPGVSAAYTRDGERLAVGSIDGTVRVWRADGTGEPVVLGRHEGLVTSVAFSPDGRRVVTGSVDGTARVWWADGTGDPVVLRGHEGSMDPVAFSPDGQRVATGSADGTVRVWRADGTGEPVVLRGHEWRVSSVAFSPDGQRVVTGSVDGTVRVWRADGAGGPVILRGHEGTVRSVTFSPDGQRIVTGSDDKTARVWRADGTGEPVVLRGHEADVGSVAFSPDGQRVVTGSVDGTARVWRVTWRGIFEYLRANLALCLSPEERMQYLGESSSEAWEKYAECERRHERTPEIERARP